ncbi:hypothetical protein IT397_00710 [Candidatus Nomurabacteria bacterium]|nr:hypothetical protein [Candidatus Nomurabacteria bacterium]
MELKEKFYLNKIKQDELEMVLLSYFGRGSGPHEGKSIYHKEETDNTFSVTIFYDPKGKIQSIESGSKLEEKDINEIQQRIYSELIDTQEVVVGRDICFVTGFKVEGYFTYKDLFQILPLPPDAPQIENQMWGHHPILLEYKYISSKNAQVNGFRKNKKSRELIPILHLLSQRRFYGPSRFGQNDWTVIGNEDPEKITSEFKQIGYFYGKPFQSGNQFSSVESMSKIEFGKSKNNELALVEDTNNLLDIIFTLEPDKYSKFITSCYWFYTANEVWKTSHSVSYVCLVTSIECLMNDVEKCECGSALTEKSIEKCEICGEPKYRLGKSFKDFLEKYSNEEYSKLSKEEKNYIYNIRSTMLHGEKVFARDFEPMGFLGYQKSYEDAFHRTISSLVFKTLINWLSLN